MALTKTEIVETVAPSRFRDLRFNGHVADSSAGELAGKLVIEFSDANPGPAGQGFRGTIVLEDVTDQEMLPQRRTRLRALLKQLAEVLVARKGFTGTAEPDPEEPAY